MKRINQVAVMLLLLLGGLLIFTTIAKNLATQNMKYIIAEYIKTYEDIETFGIVLKDEQIVEKGSTGYTDIIVGDGEKVSKGQTIANIYSNDSYILVNEELKTLQDMKSILTATETNDAAVNNKSSTLLNQGIIQYNQILNPQDVSTIKNNITHIKNLSLKSTFYNMSKEQIDLELKKIDAQIAEKQSLLKNNVDSIQTPYTGYFISGIDGYEDIEEITSETILGLENKMITSEVTSNTLGKIVCDFHWYYAAVIPVEAVNDIKGKKISLIFEHNQQSLVPVTIEEIVEESTHAVVYFKGKTNHKDMFSLRTAKAQIIVNTHYGIKIPKSATRVVDGKLGVYTSTGNIETFRGINPIYEDEDFYLIRQSKNATKNDILEGDKIIINSKNISK